MLPTAVANNTTPTLSSISLYLFTKVNAMLQWRRDANVDKIRNNILYGGMDHPTKFPYADVIMKYAYQIVIAIDALDKNGNPVSLETFNFEPKDVLKIITTDQYLEYLAYTLEYKSLVIEQLSEERERKYLHEWNHSWDVQTGNR